MTDILRIEDLHVAYHERERTVQAVDGVDLALSPGRTLALVGESGCGKTTLAVSILNLVPHPGRIDSGRIFYDGEDLLTLKGESIRRLRGRQISMIFQDPLSGLNPVLTIGQQVEEIVRTHLDVPKRDSRRMTLESLAAQGLPEPQQVFDSFPFQLSGGMCQRVMIAIATILRPRVIIADEPTSSLDVTVQASILHELDGLRSGLGAAILLITHDLGVVARMADHVAVMYAGRIIESGLAAEIFEQPRHPYTAALLAALPRHDDPGKSELRSIKGAPPDLADLSGHCAFLPRCTKAITTCRTDPWPPLDGARDGHRVACYNPVYQPERAPAERA